MPLDETGVVDASYGPAGYIEAGMYYTKSQRHDLAKSYEALEDALTYLKGTPLGMAAYVLLLGPYLGKGADPQIVKKWRKPGDFRGEWHDAAIAELAEYLSETELYVVWPERLSELDVRRQDDEEAQMYASYQHRRVAGRLRHQVAVERTAREFHVPTDRVETVIEFRRNVKADECAEPGCDRAPFSQNLCMKHYQRRRRGKRSSEAC